VKKPRGTFRSRWEDNIRKDENVWTGFMWLSILTSGRLFWTWYYFFGFHKMRGMS
jgi:hypothetical protein